jgi:hypothetical protein
MTDQRTVVLAKREELFGGKRDRQKRKPRPYSNTQQNLDKMREKENPRWARYVDD